MPRRSTLFTNGVPELLVLRLLSSREMYGYELVTAIRDATGGEIPLGEGVVYPLLHSLEADGLLRARAEQVRGRTRYYYTPTRRGEGRLKELTGAFAKIHDVVSSFLENPHHA